MENYEKSLEYLNRALLRYKEAEIENVSNVLINMGTIYRLKKDYQKALEYYQEALVLKEKLKIEYGKSPLFF